MISIAKTLSSPEFDRIEEEAWRAEETAWRERDDSVYCDFSAANSRAKKLAVLGWKVVVRRADGGWQVHAS